MIISHDLSSIYKIAHRVILLSGQQILAEGHPSDLQKSSNPIVSNFFNINNIQILGKSYG